MFTHEVTVTITGTSAAVGRFFRETVFGDTCTCATGEMDYPLPDTPEDKKPYNPATPPPGWRAATEFARGRNRFGDPNNFERK